MLLQRGMNTLLKYLSTSQSDTSKGAASCRQTPLLRLILPPHRQRTGKDGKCQTPPLCSGKAAPDSAREPLAATSQTPKGRCQARRLPLRTQGSAQPSAAAEPTEHGQRNSGCRPTSQAGPGPKPAAPAQPPRLEDDKIQLRGTCPALGAPGIDPTARPPSAGGRQRPASLPPPPLRAEARRHRAGPLPAPPLRPPPAAQLAVGPSPASRYSRLRLGARRRRAGGRRGQAASQPAAAASAACPASLSPFPW